MRSAFLFLLLTLFFAGCAHAPIATPTGLKPDAFWKEQTARIEETRHLSSRVSFRYESKKENVGGQGRLLLQSPDQLRMELRDPFGRLQYLVTLSDKQFVARYPTKNLAYLDKIGGAAYLKRVLGINVSFTDLDSLLIGVLPDSLKRAKFDNWTWDGEAGFYVGTFNLPSRKVECGIDPQSGALRRVKVSGLNSADNVTIQYSDFSPCCKQEKIPSPKSFSLAHAVALEMEVSGTKISLDWDQVQSFQESKPADVFQAELPEKTRKVNLD